MLTASLREDNEELGAEAHTSYLTHLKEVRKAAEDNFGMENILTEEEAQDVMVGVSVPIATRHSDHSIFCFLATRHSDSPYPLLSIFVNFYLPGMP